MVSDVTQHPANKVININYLNIIYHSLRLIFTFANKNDIGRKITLILTDVIGLYKQQISFKLILICSQSSHFYQAEI